MPQKSTPQPRIRISVTTSQHVYQYLRELVDTGLYGGTVPEAAEIILCRFIEERLKTSKLDPISPSRLEMKTP
jgi:hypothetical protein